MATEHTTTTTDGIELHLWCIRGAGAGTVIVGHGIGLTKSASLRHAALLHELGYDVLLFDHRNHGLSAVDRSQEHLAERYSNDIAATIAVASAMWPESRRLIVWGFSFSTFPTLHSLRHETTEIDAVICDSGPGLDLDEMLRSFIAGGTLPVPRPVRRLLQRRAVVDAFASSAVRMLGTEWPPDPETSASGSIPMLFLSGSADEIVRPEQVRALASRYPQATFVQLPSGHLQGIKAASLEYREAVTTFLGSLSPARTDSFPPSRRGTA